MSLRLLLFGFLLMWHEQLSGEEGQCSPEPQVRFLLQLRIHGHVTRWGLLAPRLNLTRFFSPAVRNRFPPFTCSKQYLCVSIDILLWTTWKIPSQLVYEPQDVYGLDRAHPARLYLILGITVSWIIWGKSCLCVTWWRCMTQQIFCFRDVFPYDTNAYCVIVRLSVCGWNEEWRVFQAAPVKQVPLMIPDLKWSSRTYQLPCSGSTSWERSICGMLLRWCLSGTFSAVTQVLSRWSGPFTLFFHYLWLLSSFKRNNALKCSRRRKWHFRQQVIVIHYFIFDFLLIVFKFTQVQK